MTDDVLHCDKETRSIIDLRRAGVYIYAGHPTTDLWCASFAFNDEPWFSWRFGQPLPKRVAEHVQRGRRFVSHNVSFEWALWNGCAVPKYGWPKLSIEQCDCTAARAAAMSLPRDLEGAAAAVGLNVQKDMAGKRLMLQMCRPRRGPELGCPICHGSGVKGKGPCDCIVWWDQPDKIERLIAYCGQDTEVERGLEKRILPLSPQERRVWLLDHKINTRGVALDMPLVSKAQAMVEAEQVPIGKELSRLTGGQVTAGTQVQQIMKWLRTRFVDTPSIDKEHILDLLEEDLPEDVEKVLLLRQESAKASNAKLKSMQSAVSSDGRVRSMFLYHGASTGRWSGARVQLHNMPRPDLKFEEVEEAIPYIMAGEAEMLRLLFGSPINVVSSCLRSMLVAAPGKTLITADFSNIEGRTLAWLAGQNDLVELFRQDGPIYERMGASVFGLTTEEVIAKGKNCLERDIGKRLVLGAGYGMGPPKFKATCKKEGNLRIELSLAEKGIKAWRERNDRIVDYWKALESAAIAAVEHPGSVTEARVIKFRKVGSFLFGRLPSGRAICYPYPSVYQQVWVKHRNGKKGTMPIAEARERQASGNVTIEGDPFPGLRYKGVDNYTRRWGDIRTYGGMFAENFASGMARDCLSEALLRLEENGYPIVVHVHDEAGAEVEVGRGSEAEFQHLMAQVPDWAPGLPIKVEGWAGERYRK